MLSYFFARFLYFLTCYCTRLFHYRILTFAVIIYEACVQEEQYIQNMCEARVFSGI